MFQGGIFEKAVVISGADIIMQLDDVVHSLTTGPRLEEAMYRSVLLQFRVW